MYNEVFAEDVSNNTLFEFSDSYDELNEKNRLLGWDVHYRQLQPMEYQGGLAALEFDDSAVLIEHVDVPSEVVGEFEGDVVWIMFSFALAGQGICLQGSESTSAFLLNLGGEVDVVTRPETRLAHVSIDIERFNREWAALAPGIEPFQYGYFGFIDIPPNQAMASYRDIARLLTGDYALDMTREEYVSSVVAMLALNATRGSDQYNRRPRLTARQRVRARARDYIRMNLGDPIRLPELCKYAGASISTLSRVFAEYYGMSPAAYVRWHRMHECNKTLQRSDPAEGSVGDVIRACGINHPGRFASEYRLFFGESPKETLGYLHR